MKWPFVSREQHEARIADYQRVLETYREFLAGADARYHEMQSRWAKLNDDLLARYHMLRLQGFSEPAAIPVVPSVQPVDAITQAVNAKSGGDPELRRLMLEQVAEDRADGRSEAEILASIWVGRRALQTEDDAAASVEGPIL